MFVNLTSGNLATSQITNLSTATGQTVALSTGSGAITVDNVAGFGANIASDNLQLTTAGPAEGITLDTSLTAGSATLTAAGTIGFNVSGSTTAAPSLQTAGSQVYNGAVQLQAGTVLASTAAGNVTFNGAINGPNALEVDSAGNEVFNGAIGDVAPLASLTTDAVNVGGQAQFNMTAPGGSNPAGVNAATVTINDMAVFNIGNSTPLAPSVQTAGQQTYNGAVTLAKTTLLQSVSGGLAFNSTVDGPQSLSLVSGPGGVAFAATVGGTMPLKSINVSTTGLVQLAGAVAANLQWRRGKRGVQYPANLASQSPKPVPAADRRRYHTDCHGNHRRQSCAVPNRPSRNRCEFPRHRRLVRRRDRQQPVQRRHQRGRHGDPHREPERLDPAVDCQARHRAGAHSLTIVRNFSFAYLAKVGIR